MGLQPWQVLHKVRVDNVGPPVIRNSVARSRDMWEVAEPPAVMQANFTVAPFPAVDGARLPAQIGEMVPGMAAAWHSSRIAPVVIFHAVGREVDVAALGTARIFLIVAHETLEKVGVS